MGAVIGAMLPYAIGIAISPLPIVAVILMLFSRRAGANGPAFLGGWVVGLLAAIAVVLVLSGLLGASASSTPAWVAWLQLVLGVLLLVLGYRRWASRPPAGVTPPLPPWLQAVEELTPGTAFVMGALLSGVNPKNLALTAGATLMLTQGGLGGTDLLIAIGVFVVLASLSIGLPVAYQRFGGANARSTLDTWKTWLVDENATVMAVLLIVFGVVLLGKGIAGL
jgi:hypothetical protein